MNVRTGAPMVPMSGMPPNPMMPNQPMNMLPPPMPVPPIVPPQAAGTFPVNKDRRKRFGDSLETMLSRPPMVASDQMGGMNVFTGQMMNTAARPPVVRMRRGGDVRDMYRQAYSSPEFKAAQSAASRRNPGRTGAMTHSDLMSKIRGGSSPGDDRPAPVKMSFGDEDYTPTSAELNQELLDIGAPDKRFDVVPNAIKNIYGGMGDLDDRDDQTSTLNAINASIAAANRRAAGGFSDVEMAPGTGGLSSVPSIPSGTSSTLAQNMITFPQSPDTSMQPGPAYLPPDPNPLMDFLQTYPDELMTEPFFNTPFPEITSKNYVGSGANPLTAYGPTSSDAFLGTGDPLDLGLGDPDATQVGSGRGDPRTIPSGGQTGTGSGTGEQDDRGFVEKLKDDVKNFGRSFVKDLQMAADAGFFGGYGAMEKRLLEARNPDGSLKYTPDEVTDYIRRTKETQADQLKKQAQQSAQDNDSPMSTSPVDPCPPGFKLDPVSGICVPIEEAEEEGPSLDLNRTRDDEFNELDDIMKRIVKPVNEARILPISPMQAGGSVGLNRAADNFLAAMGA